MKLYLAWAVECVPYSDNERIFYFTDKALAEQTVAQPDWIDQDGYTWRWMSQVHETEIESEVVKSPL